MLHKQITKWIKDYAKKNGIQSLVVGVSGGIDSAVVSTLCANTGLMTRVVTMPIRQNKKTHELSLRHCEWLFDRTFNKKFGATSPGPIIHVNLDLTKTFAVFEKQLKLAGHVSDLAFANSRSRLRMMTLYQIAQSNNGIVVGTGNKVEDFGVGFFTKYGDGGVDISPIADLTKTEVWQMGRELGIIEDIINAQPTDGLWDDGRNDEDQLGMSYPDLENAMRLDEWLKEDDTLLRLAISAKEKKQVKKYREIRARNLHKMNSIPVFKKPK
jgi:NAD+ synthase